MPVEIDRVGKITALFHSWLGKAGSAASYAWLSDKIAAVASGNSKSLFIAYSSVSRHYSKQQLDLPAAELSKLKIVDWNPDNWTLDRLARSLLLLSLPSENAENYVATLEQIITAADVEEAIAFYQSLPLFPHPEKFKLRAAEGIRTNMTSVFNAVAHHNPYPANYLDDLAWNQMVLKALFVGSPLQPISGLERRSNPQLAQMLVDYARERLAAKRTISPELWELVRPWQPKTVEELATISSQL